MLRKTTAVIFMLVMTLLIALKHPVLGYCLCLNSYFTGDCVCQVEKSQPDNTSAAKEKATSPCPSCCASSETVETDNDQDTPVEPIPCDDCTEHLNIDVGDFVWQSSDKVPSDSELTVALPISIAALELNLPIASYYSPMSIRGDPPPGLYDTALPLYLKHSVLRL